MKLFSTLAALALFTTVLSAQTFNAPESVEYDDAGQRWFVGQNGSGVINVYSPGSNTLLPFATGIPSGPHGLEVLGTRLYACDGAYIRGFDLSTGAQTFSLNLGAAFLNGLTTDGSMYLFATDFTNKNIYRICPSTNTFNIMTSTTYSPNGIYYDAAGARCVFVNWGSNARIQAMAMGDSSVTTLYTLSAISNIDGITRDAAGYWYISTWGGNALRRFDPLFSAPPVSVMTGLTSPADIDINLAGDSIGIPNSGSANNVVFYTIPTMVDAPMAPAMLVPVYPNPASDLIVMEYNEEISNGTVEIYDISGNLVNTEFINGKQIFIMRKGMPYGTYLAVLRNENGEVLRRDQIVFAAEK